MRLFWWLVVPACLLGMRREDQAVIEVFIPPVPSSINASLFKAEAVATRIFSDIGISIKWRARSHKQNIGCAKRPWRIALGFSWRTPPDLRPGRLAVAQPFATGHTCITVFMDRIRPMLTDNPVLAESLLGHILAHEMAHVLRGTDAHSESGVMMPSWSPTEIRGMPRRPLRFTEHDAEILTETFRSPPNP
jgi:hypothetical protein